MTRADRIQFFSVVVIFLAAYVLYLRNLSAGFVYDDMWFIIRNPAIYRLTPLRYFIDASTAASALSGLTHDVYRPITTLSFALDYKLFGLHASMFHVENIFWHALNTCLVFSIATNLLASRQKAAIVAFVFLAHPVQVQTVAWISQRSNLLATCGSLMAIQGYFQSTSRWSNWIAAIFFALALFAKETAVVTPLIILGLELFIRRGDNRKIEKPAFLATLAVIAGIYLVCRAQLLPFSQFGSEKTGLLGNMTLALLAVPVYLGKLMLPIALRASYDYPTLSPINVGFALGCVLLTMVVACQIGRRKPLTALGLIWIVGSLLPYSQILPVRAFFAERFLYMAVVGTGIVSAELVDLAHFRPVIGGWMLFLIGSTVVATGAWSDERALWTAAVQAQPTNAFAHACLAQSLTDDASAIEEYKRALANRPSEDLRQACTSNLVRIFEKQGNFEEADRWRAQSVPSTAVEKSRAN